MKEGKAEFTADSFVLRCYDVLIIKMQTRWQITDLRRPPLCASAPRAALHRTHNSQHARKEGQKFDATAFFAQLRV